MNAILAPLGLLFQNLVVAKNLLYKNAWLKTQSVDCPVISVGNLTVGGTGKTPVVMHLLEWAVSKNIQVGVISRGYKGSYQGVGEVDLSKAASLQFGDEPALIKSRFPKVPIFVARKRVNAANALLQKYPETRLIFADDAFQHQALKRNLDIVLIDATEPFSAYKPLPWGRARESFSALERAHFVLITKSNLVEANVVESLIHEIMRSFPKEKIFKTEYGSENYVRIIKNEMKLPHRILLVSGIGRPQAFEEMLRKNNRFQVQDHVVYADHHQYVAADIEVIRKKMLEVGAEGIMTTEKDAIKLSALINEKDNIWCVPVVLKFNSGIEKLYEEIGRLAR